MAKVEIDIGDDGAVGTLPEPLQKFFDAKFGEAFGKGKAKAAEEIRSQVSTDPVVVEKLKAAEMENSKLREAEALREKNYAEAEKIRNERHARELAEREDAKVALTAEVEKRTARIQQLVGKEIRAAALDAGARRESLDELEELLSKRIGLDDGLQAFVRDAKDPGKAALAADGKTPLTIEGLVASYLADRPHHKAAPGGRGGGANGGRSLSGQHVGADADKAEALDEVARNPSINNIAAAFSKLGRSA